MYNFTHRDEGLFAEHENGKGIAHIDTKIISETNDPNLKIQQKVVTPIAREEWRIHFTGHKFTPGELEAFVKELATQEG